jgi:hypothetical protein
MPGLTYRKGLAVSLIHNQDVYIVDPAAADLAITVIGAVETDGTKHVTDIHVSNNFCRTSRYLQSTIDVGDDPTEITLGGELKCSSSNKHGNDEGENREGLLVMLACLHVLNEKPMEELGPYNISVLGVWYATSIEKTELKVDSARGLAFPCQLFDHAAAFACVTKWLAYNHVGHVKGRPPKGPKGHMGLDLPPGDFVGT